MRAESWDFQARNLGPSDLKQSISDEAQDVTELSSCAMPPASDGLLALAPDPVRNDASPLLK